MSLISLSSFYVYILLFIESKGIHNLIKDLGIARFVEGNFIASNVYLKDLLDALTGLRRSTSYFG